MPGETYTLTDLARLAGVTPRTIRYYLSQGLLPAAEAAGRATRYSEAHLARLRLIRALQREHLPLAEIRARLEQMTADDIQSALDAAEAAAPAPPRGTAATLAYVRDLMTRAGVSPRFYERRADLAAAAPEAATPVPAGSRPPAAPAEAPAPTAAAPRAVAEELPHPRPGAPTHHPRPGPFPSQAEGSMLARREMSPPTARLVPDRTTWERLSVSPDVEIHVRRPLDRLANKRVERLVRIARELFEEEG